MIFCSGKQSKADDMTPRLELRRLLFRSLTPELSPACLAERPDPDRRRVAGLRASQLLPVLVAVDHPARRHLTAAAGRSPARSAPRACGGRGEGLATARETLPVEVVHAARKSVV